MIYLTVSLSYLPQISPILSVHLYDFWYIQSCATVNTILSPLREICAHLHLFLSFFCVRGNHQSPFCIYRFAFAGYFIEVEPYFGVLCLVSLS